jgi:hypothetical protein
MRRLLCLFVIAAVSCGGKSKPANPPPVLPPEKADADDNKPEAKASEKPAEPAKPPEPQGPIDVALDAPKSTVKLVTPGKGKRAPLKLTPKAGAKQQVEIVFDVAEHQGAPTDMGGDSDNPLPSIVLTGEAEVKAVDAAGKADYVFTVTGTDVRDGSGKIPADAVEQFKAAIKTVEGLTISGSVAADGTQDAVKLHVEKPVQGTQGVLGQLLLLGLPSWPVLPTEPVAAGAKWQVTREAKVMGKIDATYTTEYELGARSGATVSIKGTTKVIGQDQTIADAKVSKVGGAGDVEIALADGALYPKVVAHDTTSFQAFVSGQDDKGAQKSGTISVELKKGTQVTPK